jgi:hypothetical protein
MTRARGLIAIGSFVGASLVASQEARAGVFLGAEFDGGAGFGMPPHTTIGPGFLATFGYRFGLGPVFLQPEIQGGYSVFPGADTPPHVARVLGGARFGLGGLVQPQLFAHVGGGFTGAPGSGPAIDGGIALAFKLIPVFSFGVQGAYNVVLDTGNATMKWLSFGVHVGLEF